MSQGNPPLSTSTKDANTKALEAIALGLTTLNSLLRKAVGGGMPPGRGKTADELDAEVEKAKAHPTSRRLDAEAALEDAEESDDDEDTSASKKAKAKAEYKRAVDDADDDEANDKPKYESSDEQDDEEKEDVEDDETDDEKPPKREADNDKGPVLRQRFRDLLKQVLGNDKNDKTRAMKILAKVNVTSIADVKYKDLPALIELTMRQLKKDSAAGKG